MARSITEVDRDLTDVCRVLRGASAFLIDARRQEFQATAAIDACRRRIERLLDERLRLTTPQELPA